MRNEGAGEMTENRRQDRGIIRPRKGRGDPAVGPDALMVIIPSQLEHLARRTGAEEVPFSERTWYRLYRAPDASGGITLCGPFLGAPHAVMGMEKLIALGARRIWVLGWCGSLQPDLRAGHAVIPTGAVSGEGTSAHYPIGDRPVRPDPGLVRRLARGLGRAGIPFKKGTVWTTDAIYRETVRKIRSLRDRGVLAVEMELSALMTVAIFRSVSLGALLVVSDELADLKWRPGFSDPQFRKNSLAAAEVLLQAAAATGADEPGPSNGPVR